jgi:hypothetical protein
MANQVVNFQVHLIYNMLTTVDIAEAKRNK